MYLLGVLFVSCLVKSIASVGLDDGKGIGEYGSKLVFFFFFQAEDGIRDWSVTGVQTCALPISRRKRREGPI